MLFIIIWNATINSHLPLIRSTQWYFQNHSCSVNTISHPVPSHSILLFFSEMVISFMPTTVYFCILLLGVDPVKHTEVNLLTLFSELLKIVKLTEKNE